MAEICKTDLQRIVTYLDSAAELYGRQEGQQYVYRQFYLRQMSKKLKLKLKKFHND